jgi:hypothetical protein
MIESFSQNKWKYTTIGLAAVLAIGFSFPEAFAAASLDSVLSIVKDIQTKVNNLSGPSGSISTLQTQITSIKTKTDNLPADPASEEAITESIDEAVTQVGARKAAIIEYDLNPNGATIPRVPLPFEEGRTYAGSLDITVKADSDGQVFILCFVGGGLHGFSMELNDGDRINRDFVCKSISINLSDLSDNDEPSHVEAFGMIQYVEVYEDNVTLLDD